MGKEFFNGWELWQKMTFVLACAIVLTIIGGLIKLKYDHYKIRKYTQVEKMKQNDPTPEMLEAAREEERKDDEVPFGIRAIESGIEVEGVWISRSNTPVGSSASSINDGSFRIPRSLNNSHVELPRPAYASSSRDSSRTPNSFDRAVSAERLPSDYSNSLSRNSTALHALEGFESAGPSTSRNDSNRSAQPSSSDSNTSRRTSDESDFLSTSGADRPYEPAYIKQAPVDPRMDLNLLQSHRLSHVAETGQLTPRVRRPGQSGEWASTADNLRSDEISTVNGVNYFVPRQKTPSPPLRPVVEPRDDVSTPAGSAYGRDGHASNTAKQAVPLLETYQPQAYQPRGPQHMYDEEEASEQYPVSTPQHQRQSQVLRKVNSGFEILRPGTFPEPTPEEIAQAQANEKRQSRKLQKKRRSSEASTKASHFVEQV
ncbi:hypothetical protein GQ43DRAFT_460599 [Delitschia confertaspora ATCC 74209]|uniref:Uncharacterized protein n=1 Tax=Delitschia confertaspora ATCC 74209 TaxID=1513339 RepID=A0A9P4JUH6_9PLEO|nr:hypothetical protein GQ43DRAFT_460599 [Delitschia confertaspora ATCC 74209]